MYICNTILCFILPLHQIAKRIVNSAVRMLLIHRLCEWRSNLQTSLFWRPLSISLYFFPLFGMLWKHYVEFFFWNLRKLEDKKYIECSLSFIAMKVYPTMMTSEKPGNIKKGAFVLCVQSNSMVLLLYFDYKALNLVLPAQL